MLWHLHTRTRRLLTENGARMAGQRMASARTVIRHEGGQVERDAQALHRTAALEQVYMRLGCKVSRIAKGTVEERSDQALEECGLASPPLQDGGAAGGAKASPRSPRRAVGKQSTLGRQIVARALDKSPLRSR